MHAPLTLDYTESDFFPIGFQPITAVIEGFPRAIKKASFVSKSETTRIGLGNKS